MTGPVIKAELHCHIEGAIPPALARAQAQRYGVDTASFISGDRYVWHDFTTFMAAYDGAAALFRTPEDYALLAETYLGELDAAGAVYSEIFVSPDHARTAGLSSEAYIEGLAEGIARAREKSGIECRMIVVGVRHLGTDAVEGAARFAAARPHPLITGFGMAGEERFGRVADYARAFDIARDAGLGITIHAGELVGGDSVRDALDVVRPSRIGHGVRAVEDLDLVRRLADEGTVLEVCPGSNVALNVFPDFAAHPFRRLMDAGVKVTLASDDPPFFDTSLAREYVWGSEAFGLSDDQLRDVTRTAIEAAFVDEPTRQALLAKL